jgi:general secretion pathway protein D
MVLQRQLRRTIPIAAAAALGTTLLAGGASRAWAEDIENRRSTSALQNVIVEGIELVDAPLPVAINLIKQKTGIEIVFTGKGANFSPVSLSLRRRPITEVLQLMAKSAKADLWEENGVFFIGPEGSAPKPAAAPDPEPEIIPIPAGPMRWEKIRLMYTDPHIMVKMLSRQGSPMSDMMEQFTLQSFQMMLNAQKTPYLTSQPVGNILMQAAPFAPNQSQPAAAPSAPISNNNFTPNGTMSLNNPGNPFFDQNARRDGDHSSEFGRGGQFGGGFGGGRGGGFGGGGQGFGGGQPGGGGFGGQPGGQGQGGQFGQGGQGGGAASGLLPEGLNQGDLLAYDADGSIIVRSNNDQALRQLREIIRLLDVKPRQIMVRAEFVTVTQNDVSSFGINWNFQRVGLIGGVNTGFQTSNTAFLSYQIGNFSTQMSWILTTGRGKLVAAPMATTLNNVPVNFNTTVTVPAIVSTPVFGFNGTVALAPQIIPVQATTGLFVLPRINGDDTISLMGTIFVQDFGNPVTGPNGETFPTTIFQTAPVQRIIRNGDTLVIGGLTRKNTTVSTNRVPLLGDLPFLGTLFRSRNVTTDDSDLLVFITASILPERQSGPALPGPGGGPLAAPGGALAPGGASGGLNP